MNSTHLTDQILAKLEEICARRDDVAQQLEDPNVLADHRQVRDLSIRKAALDPLASGYERWKRLSQEAENLRQEIASGQDSELRELAQSELPELEHTAQHLINEMLERLVNTDDRQVASVMLEIRSASGGDEAALWARDLMEMYQKYASRRGWSFEPMDVRIEEAAGGIRSAIITVAGDGVWAEFAHEAGIHCVKRVPATESQGRIHTSTATVAVMPEPREIELSIDPADVVEHITTAQGPGGQNVNKVATAVHLMHKPSGIEVRMQETKSQAQNREKAWRLLRARLFEQERAKQQQQESAQRLAQIGGGGRSERIRTYRFKDNIAVDHRLNESFALEKVLSGDLDELAKRLTERETARRLSKL